MAKNQSTEDLQQLLEHLEIAESVGKVGTWSFDISTGKISWNDQMFNIFPEKKEMGEPDFERHRSTIHEEDRDNWEAVVKKCFEDGLNYQMDFRACHPDGKVVWVRAHGKGVFDENGKVLKLQGTCQDISELKKLELEKSEIQKLDERLQSVGNIGGWKLCLETGRTQWTKQIYDIHKIPYGTPTDKVNGIEFYLEHERPRLIDCIEKCQKGIPFDDTFQFKDAEGTVKWVRSIGMPVSSFDGEITYIEGTFQDVTEQVQREHELKESKTYLSLAIQGAQLGIWDWWLEDNSVRFDRRWCEMLGLDVNSIAMELSTWESRVHPEDLEQCFKDIKAYLNGETEFYENIHRMKHSNGEWLCILDRGRISEWDSDGKPIRFTGTHLNITETESLKRERDHIFSEFKIGTFKWDILQDFVQWDANNYKVYGVEEKDFKNAFDAWASAVHPDWVERAQQDVQDALDGKRNFDTVFRINTKDDTPKYIRGVAKIERDPQGKPVFMTGLNMDVTAQILAEEELSKKKELDIHQAKLASIGELAAGVGHEINNPLAIINGYLRILERSLENNKSKEVEKITSKIEQASHRIKNIVKGLRNFSRAIDDDSSLFCLKEVLQESVDMIKEIYLSEGIKVNFDATQLKRSSRVNAVRGQIQQVLLNLISNAKDASEGMNEREIDIFLRSIDGSFEIEVADNGKGISENVSKKIFEPFFTTKEVNRGTGIGLSMALRLAENNMGAIRFDSVEGEGANFFLRLPFAHEQENLIEDPVDSVAQDKPLSRSFSKTFRILLLDDEEDIREIICDQLEMMNFEVETVSSGNDALEALASTDRPYDFVLSDVKMPGMNGEQFLENALKNFKKSFRSFVFMTGGTNVDFEDPSKGFEGKIDGYIYKPFSESELSQLLMDIAERKSSKAPEAFPKAS